MAMWPMPFGDFRVWACLGLIEAVARRMVSFSVTLRLPTNFAKRVLVKAEVDTPCADS